jgi:2-hydroxymuconate-semialdehyde hydrolase
MSKFGKKPFLFFIFVGFLLNSSCSYLVKNDQHEVYSISQYGTDKFVVAKGYNIHYVEAGQGEPVFLIPGAFSTYRHWNKVIPFLSNHYRLFCIDYLGVGDSDKPRSGFKYTIEEQADLIADMMERLQISKVHIVGVSYGGAIALNVAARYPERVGKIVSIEGNGINGNKHQKISYGPMADFLRFPLIGEIAVGVIRSTLADQFVAKSVMGKAWDDLNELEKKQVLEIVSQSNRTAARISWFHISRTLRTSKDFSEEAKAISTPVLYLYGENSDYHDMAKANADFLKAHLPDVEVISFQDGIHDLQLQKPEEVARLISEFLGKNGMNQQNTVNSNNQVSR